MKSSVKVSGSELKMRIEKAFTTKELRHAINYIAEMFKYESTELPCWMEGIIIERLRNAGVDIKKYGGWYRCMAAYALLPKMDELIEFEQHHERLPEYGGYEDPNVVKQRFKIVNEAITITLDDLGQELENEK